MPREAPLPPQWKVLEGRVQYVQRVSDKEYCASCMECGGTAHPDGEWPDRLRIFVDDHPTAWCRRCGVIAYPDQFGDGTYKRPDAIQLEQWRKDQEAREEARRRSVERALATLRDGRLWERYHRELGDTGRSYWRQAGIPDAYADWWRLGWAYEQRYSFNGQPFITDAATIPIFGPDWAALNIKLRLLSYPDGAGKYRYEIATGKAPMFLCDPDTPTAEHIIAVEGEKKAMVTFATLDTQGTCMVGMPGTNPGPALIAHLQQASRVTLIMDPGTEAQTWALVKKIGRAKCHVLIPPAKIDDGIVAAQLGKHELRALLRHAVPCE